jgi:outer membrane protein OmpA-like peptidoglycan-associated protein
MIALQFITYLVFTSTIANAQDAVTLSATRHAQLGYSWPSMTLHAHVDGHLNARLSCSGRTYSAAQSIAPGDAIAIVFDELPLGDHRCTGSLTLKAADGTSGEMPLSVNIGVLKPLSLTVEPQELDLENHTMRVRSSRPLTHLKVEVTGASGSSIGMGETPVANMDGADLQWTQSPGEAIKLLVTGVDMYNLPGKLELSPWSYNIPHEDVVFATGKSAVSLEEEPKMETAWKELQAVVQKYGDIIEVRLYIGGYTDTVGPSSSNETLSKNRARAIASWFRRRGFSGPVFYQGFGESGLAVPTADNVNNAQNRRAMYILAAQTPLPSSFIPRSNWIPLQ